MHVNNSPKSKRIGSKVTLCLQRIRLYFLLNKMHYFV